MVWVTLEGNIGAGKSTLIRAVRGGGAERMRVVEEPVADWEAPVLPGGRSALGAFYEDPRGRALAFQMAALLSRLRCSPFLGGAAQGGGCTLMERCIASSTELFVRPLWEQGALDDLAWHTYLAWEGFARAQAEPTPPDAVVYLRCPPEVCAARVAGRARAGEAPITHAYLHALHLAHEAWVEGQRAAGRPVLVLDAAAGEPPARQAERVLAFCAQLSPSPE